MVVLTNMHLFSVGKGRRPRFELHLKIHDLNNVPLVAGHSYIKWHLPYSMHADHRGRTGKCSILNHRVEYAFDKVIAGIRMSVDRNSQLTECPMEFEILQEFDSGEKITLGFVRLNLAEYVEECGALFRDGRDGRSDGRDGRDVRELASPPPTRRRADSAATSLNLSPTATRTATRVSEEHVRERDAEEGIVRRYLIQDSKINSTLKIGILLIQVEGDRNYVAPPLKTAPVFGGIAGFMAPEQVEDDAGPLPNLVKNRDVAEVQDLYRRTLAASWSRQPAELPADECIEDIFSGGNGWKTKIPGRSSSAPQPSSSPFDATSEDEMDDTDRPHSGPRSSGTRRPTFHSHRRMHSNSSSSPFRIPHRRTASGSSDKSVSTVTATPGGSRSQPPSSFRRTPRPYYLEDHQDDGRSSTGSPVSLTPPGGSSSSSSSSSSGSERERERSAHYPHHTGHHTAQHHHYHHHGSHVKEIGEFEARDDMVCWSLGAQS